jgi:hypothetical protein
MSTTFGRALRTALTLACALAALAVVAGPAAASETLLPTGASARLAVLGAEYDADTNTYTVDADGQLTVDLAVGGTGYDPTATTFPRDQERFFCTFPEFAGVYAIFGLLASVWQPSDPESSPESRRAGPSAWANIINSATTPGREGCGLFPGQTLLEEEGAFLTTLEARFCVEGGVHYLTGRAFGGGGRVVTYLWPSATDTWHLYSVAAFGTVSSAVEQVVNVNVTDLPDESASCASTLI